MITQLLKLLHRQPIWSTAILLVLGMAIIFANMVFLSQKMNEDMAEHYAENYIHALNTIQSLYSSSVVAQVKTHGIEAHSDYKNNAGTIPFPATFSIELAESLTDPKTGIVTRMYSDFPFSSRQNGGPHDEFESLALTTFRFANNKEKPFTRYEMVNGHYSYRYAKAIIMQQSCVDCHNSHPESTKKDWRVGDVRGVRTVSFPMDTANQQTHKGWTVTLVVMIVMSMFGLGLIFIVIQALRASIDTLSKTNSAINRFVPHEFLNYLNKQNIMDVQLNDNIETRMTVLFADIRSFTELSEHMTPEQNFQFVNDYLKVMGPVVRRNNGFIDKYIGDAIMALFDNTDDAVKAALEMLAVLEQYNIQHLQSYSQPIRIGLGLHRGKVRLGTIGEHNRMDSTVISDAVNLASRIEGLTKYYGVPCLVSEEVYRQLNDSENIHIRYIDKVKVKGKNVPVSIYEVFSADDSALCLKKLATQPLFEEAAKLYEVREFKKALVLFYRVLGEFPEDMVTQSYILRCTQYAAEGAGKNWDGALQLDSK